MSRFLISLGEGQHGFHLFGHLHHRIVELGADILLERLESRPRPKPVPPCCSISLSQPQAMQSSISSATLPNGLK